MTLSEIYVQLPPSVASYLEELLEQVPLPEHPTREEVLKAATELSIELKYSIMDVAHNADPRVVRLLDQLPEAITEELF